MRTHYTNAVVFSGNADAPLFTDFYVEDGLFVAADEPMRSCEPLITVDLKGAFVMPAFIDAHTHASLVASSLTGAFLTPPAVRTIDELVEALRATKAAQTGEGWIEGAGYDESLLEGNVSPTRWDLDRVSTTQPVLIRRSDCHSAVANSKALELAGLTDASPDPEGGALGRDAEGRLDGRLIETPAVRLVERAAGGTVTEEDLIARALSAGNHYLERGILNVTDMMTVRRPYDPLKIWREACRRGLPLDVDLYLTWLGGEDPYGMPDLTESETTGAVRYAGVKLFADGSISGRTAAMRESFRLTDDEAAAGVGPKNGEILLTEPVFRAALAYAKRNGIQASVHVMGDAAMDALLEWLRDEDDWLEGIPSLRIEHATFFRPDQLEKLEKLAIRPAVTTQVIFPFAEYPSYRAFLSEADRNACYPVRSIAKTVDAFALSSDAPATTWADPDQVFVSVQAAVTRRDATNTVFGGHEAVDVATALSLYTGRAALVLPTEGTVGIIEPGARAHFVILTANPFKVHTAKLGEIRVAALYRDGIERWKRED